MKLTILGGGLAAVSLAYFLQQSGKFDEIEILEKEEALGGLCRSIKKDGYTYDIGPHILFSKDKEMLNLMLGLLPAKNDLRRSNQIIYKGRYIQYPFENDLSKLPAEELKYCVSAFQNNPYENYEPQNMLQFFLKTFGEGITNTYLRPYNEKIWKFDPSFMDTQMVERIPKPTDEELMRSASGETVEGYVHQLYFSYPSEGGIETVVKSFSDRLNEKCRVLLSQNITCVERTGSGYRVISNGGEHCCDCVISTIPVQELAKIYDPMDELVRERVEDLKYNSILIAFVKTKKDSCGDNFAFMNPEKDIIFHRISKMDFLGSAYKSDGATYMVEVTYRHGDRIDRMPESEVEDRITEGLISIGFAAAKTDVEFVNITRHPYAYVIYDLKHKDNMKAVRNYFEGEGVHLHGRFGNFEYWNMDRILRESKNLAENLSALAEKRS